MLQEAGCLTKDVSVLRRLTYAAASLNKDVPDWSQDLVLRRYVPCQ